MARYLIEEGNAFIEYKDEAKFFLEQSLVDKLKKLESSSVVFITECNGVEEKFECDIGELKLQKSVRRRQPSAFSKRVEQEEVKDISHTLHSVGTFSIKELGGKTYDLQIDKNKVCQREKIIPPPSQSLIEKIGHKNLLIGTVVVILLSIVSFLIPKFLSKPIKPIDVVEKNDTNKTTIRPVVAQKDTTPDKFSFESKKDVELEKEIESNEITVTGINSPALVNITSGEYSINSTSFKKENSTIKSNDKIKVRHTSHHQPLSTVTTTLDIGGVKAKFNSTTKAKQQPEVTVHQKVTLDFAISFIYQYDKELNVYVESSQKKVSGFNGLAKVEIIDGEFSIDGKDWQSNTSSIKSGQKIKVRHKTSPKPYSVRETTLIIGGNESLFQSRTKTGN